VRCRAILPVALVVAVAAGCSLTSEAGTAQAPLSRLPAAKVVSLVRVPVWASLACGSLPAARTACPQVWPVASGTYDVLALTTPTPGLPVTEFSLQQSSGTASQVTVVVGGAGAVASRLADRDADRVPLRTAKDAGNRRRAESFGTYDWGGHRGALMLTRSVAGIGVGNLLTFTWAGDGRTFAVGIGAWDPLPTAAATLRAIVRHGLGAPGRTATSVYAPVARVPMVAAPNWLTLLCRTELGPAPCPAAIPRPSASLAVVQVSSAGGAGGREIDAAFGGESGNPRRDRPPFLVHLTFSNQRAPGVRETPAAAPIDLLHDGYPSHPVYLGAPVWGGHQGTLSLGAGLCFGNHLCYRWREAARTYTVSMHAGSPLSQSVAVFRAVVSSTAR
jgi:hypothetical protein